MKSTFSQFMRLMNRHSRNGQSLLIVAFAFIGLVAFVGIAVDVGLMLVRYSTLARAVDAAAIAAAGQIREGMDYRTLVAAAQQFIRLQGNIEVSSVFVDTCETEMADYARRHPGSDPLPALLNRVPPSELCRPDPQKLVRVTAQMRSPTTFLSFIWGPEIILEASAVSQTAVLDLALVIDTSRSMAYDTILAQENSILYPVAASSVDAPYGNPETNREALRAFRPFTETLGLKPYPYRTPGDASDTRPEDPDTGLAPDGSPAIRRECWYANPKYIIGDEYKQAANYGWGGCCNDPTTQSAPPDSGNYDRMNWYVYDDPTLPESKIMTTGISPTGAPAARVISGLPDGNFSDLICQPFKQVRDAARRFIKRLDFVRGDRLVLVTFNAEVKTVKPTDDPAAPPFILDKLTAVTTLNERVGISVNPAGRQSPNCYILTRPRSDKIDNSDVNVRQVYSYWTVSQCMDTNMGGAIYQARAELSNPNYIRREAVWVMVLLSDGFPNRTPDYDFFVASDQVRGSDSGINWLSVPPDKRQPSPFTLDELKRYCRCEQAYRKDDETLYNCFEEIMNIMEGVTRREDYREEMIVDLGGGRFDLKYGREPQYCIQANGWPPAGENLGEIPWGQSKYSFGFCPWYTFCNGSSDPEQVMRYGPVLSECDSTDVQPFWWRSHFSRPWRGAVDTPDCIDADPDTRHFCMDDYGRLDLSGRCDRRYDPDDFARDQADIAGLIDFSDKQRGNFISMFTIFFGSSERQNIGREILGVKTLRYIADAGDNGVIDNHLQAWYRATRPTYSQREAIRRPDGRFPPPGDEVYRVVRDGVTIVDPTRPPDPCAYYDYTHPRLRSAQPGDAAYEEAARQNCGQFWFAKDIRAVNEAFTEIAGRLFTRLSR